MMKVMMMQTSKVAPLASLQAEGLELALTSRGIGAGGVGGGLGGVAGGGALGGTGGGLRLDVRGGVLGGVHRGRGSFFKCINYILFNSNGAARFDLLFHSSCLYTGS
jgi:hypothetical protein